MRHDHNSSVWAGAVPRPRAWSRRLAFTGVALVVTVISVASLRDHALTQPAVACTQAWPYLDAGCGNRTNAADRQTRPVRVIGIDRNAPAVVAKAPADVTPKDVAAPVVAAPALVAKSDEPPSSQALQVASPEQASAATDGAGRENTATANATAKPPAVAAAPLSEEDLTFRTGAAHRPGAVVTAKEETVAPEPARKAASKLRRTTTRQIVELPDGRRVTFTRGNREVREPYERRMRAADMGPRFEEASGGFFGPRRGPRGLGGLY
jgi:hypothetical protein